MVSNQSFPQFPPSLVEVAEISSTDDASEQFDHPIEYHQPYHRHLLSPIPEGGSIIDDESCYPLDEEVSFDSDVPCLPPNDGNTAYPLPKGRPPVPPRTDIISCLWPITPLTGATTTVPRGYLQICGRVLPPPVDRPSCDEGPLSPSLSSKGIIDFPYDFPVDSAPQSARTLGRSDSESSRNSSSTDEVHSDSKLSTGRWKRLFRSRKSSNVSVPLPPSLLDSSPPVVSEFGAVESAESLTSDEKQSSLGRSVFKKLPKKFSNLDSPSKSEAEPPLTNVTKVSRKFPGFLKLSAVGWPTDSASEHGSQPSLIPRMADGSFLPTPSLSAHDLGKVNAWYAPVPILPLTPRRTQTPKPPATSQLSTSLESPSTPDVPPIPSVAPAPKMISSHKSTPCLRTAQSLDAESISGSNSIYSSNSAHSSDSSWTIPPPKPVPTCELPPTPVPAIVVSPASTEDKRNTIYFVIEPEWDQNSDDDVPFQFVPREAVPTGESRACVDHFNHRMSLRPRSVSNPELLAASMAKSLASVVEGAGY
ncbi:hypothetical protein ARMGADRAFT_536025 [Armillaria gallica]|uniref:Uncharacterized protein n=1 Tax=Armillaria gallica TaxID=47427 RepID=A0A2H3CTN4_ARMGA|nr:hypothetical protein ARMGADRAFT_536025 [Armillaria gallica]